MLHKFSESSLQSLFDSLEINDLINDKTDTFTGTMTYVQWCGSCPPRKVVFQFDQLDKLHDGLKNIVPKIKMQTINTFVGVSNTNQYIVLYLTDFSNDHFDAYVMMPSDTEQFSYNTRQCTFK